jgi:predicted patatin/cPLA2 family phospholipase
MCRFTSIPLRVPDTIDQLGRPLQASGGATEALARAEVAPDPFAQAVRLTLEAGDGRADRGQRQSFLALSGGSLNGAYGAGFLEAWQANAPGKRLPAFATVTGVSTGAILATFAFTDMPAPAVQGYSIEREDQLLKPFVKMKNGEPTTMSYLSVIRKGALGDLAPLRARLNQTITDEILQLVAQGQRDGRRLYVGVVDADTGEAEAFDMTDMALRYSQATDQTGRQIARDCYIEAVVASSSAPLAAAPVFIDNRMLIDGGARFGMFTIAFETATRDYLAKPEHRDKDDAPVTFLLINGAQAISRQCGKLNRTLCTREEPTGGRDGAHAPWSFTKLALRSEGILANQVYRFSEAQVGADARFYHVTRIGNDVGEHLYTMRPAMSALGSGTKRCSDWRDDDLRLDNPVQFYPRYMQCLIDYGRAKSKDAQWWTLDMKAAPGPLVPPKP